MFLSEIDRENRLRQGISNVNIRRIRTNAGNKDTSEAGDNTLAAIHNTRYAIPLDHTIIKDHGIFYPRGLPHPLRFELTLAKVSDVVVYSNTETPANYKLINMEMEYQCISNDYLAREAVSSYKVGRIFTYEKVLLHKTFTISEANDAVINQHINVPRRSLTGILCLFTALMQKVLGILRFL